MTPRSSYCSYLCRDCVVWQEPTQTSRRAASAPVWKLLLIRQGEGELCGRTRAMFVADS